MSARVLVGALAAAVALAMTPAGAGAVAIGPAVSAAADNGMGHAIPGDGRYVAFRTPGGRVAVFDTKTRRRRTQAVPAGCEPVSLAYRRVLLTCDPSSDGLLPPRIMAVDHGPSHRVRGWRKWEEFTRIGRYWIEGFSLGSCPSSDCQYQAYVDWRTGRRTTKPIYAGDFDVDSPKLRSGRPHPRPLPHRDWALVASTRHVAVLDSGRQLFVTVDGSRPRRIGTTVVGSCCNEGDVVRIGGGLLTWVLGRRLHVYDLARAPQLDAAPPERRCRRDADRQRRRPGPDPRRDGSPHVLAAALDEIPRRRRARVAPGHTVIVQSATGSSGTVVASSITAAPSGG